MEVAFPCRDAGREVPLTAMRAARHEASRPSLGKATSNLPEELRAMRLLLDFLTMSGGGSRPRERPTLRSTGRRLASLSGNLKEGTGEGGSGVLSAGFSWTAGPARRFGESDAKPGDEETTNEAVRSELSELAEEPSPRGSMARELERNI